MRLLSALRVFQYHPTVAPSDAIGNSIWALHRRLSAGGMASGLFCAARALQSRPLGVASVDELLARTWSPNDVLIVHYSFLDERFTRILSLPVRKVLVFHNVTPGRFFDRHGFEALASLCDAARSQIATAHAQFELTITDSDFNSRELPDLGEKARRTIPVFYDAKAFRNPIADASTYFNLKQDNAVNLLFVGRFVPNKRHDKLIEMVALLRKLTPRPIRLHLVGKVWSDGYLSNLLDIALGLGVLSDLRLHIDAKLADVRSLYGAADAFVSLSEHEGFMVPLLEAFSAGCPVVADPGTAVGETMGYAGARVANGSPSHAAGLVALLLKDGDARLRLLRDQARRAQDFTADKVFAQWLDALSSFGAIRRLEG